MGARRWALSGIAQSADTTLRLRDGACSLEDAYRVLGVLPLRIGWEGAHVEDRLVWETSWARLGWKRFGRSLERPAPAEALRSVPWRVRGPRQFYGVLVVEKEDGGGRAVFSSFQSEELSVVSAAV